MMHAVKFHLATEEDTQRLGAKLAELAPFKPSIWLHGELGAGKSTLSRACLSAMGVTGAIKSPTYTLVERYTVDGGEAWHLDLYRIASPEELDYLGLDDAQVVMWLVEWPERGQGFLAAPDLEVFLSYAEDGGRNAEFLTQNSEIANVITLWK